MKSPTSALSIAAFILALTAPVLAADAPYGHIHLMATDPSEAAAWYERHMGGERFDRDAGNVPGPGVFYGNIPVLWIKRDAGFPGSVGSSVDHIGFSFPDLAAKMASYEAAGVKITSEVRDVQGKFKFAFVEDPWGTKIEVMEDPETLGLHHIHLKGPEPEKIFAWYESAFGGERAKFKGMLPALRYDPVWLLVQDSKGEEMAPTQGRSIDHLGWNFPDLTAAQEELTAKGVVFTMAVTDFKTTKIAFVEGPGGVRIELVEAPMR